MDVITSWQQQCEREAAYDKIIDSVRQDLAKQIATNFQISKVWSGHFGATGIDPKHLFAYFVVPLRSDVRLIKESPRWAAYRQQFLELIVAAGYPTSIINPEAPGLFSDQECEEEAAGNWHHFFK
jgi:hypothetical protein